MKRRISHAQATTCIPWRVIHVRSFWCARATVGRLAPLANVSTAVASPLPSLAQQQSDKVRRDEFAEGGQARSHFRDGPGKARYLGHSRRLPAHLVQGKGRRLSAFPDYVL